MPLDEIGLLMFSRMMHKHCAVFFNEVWWTTRKDNNLKKCDCWLIYRGKLQFTDTMLLTKDEWKSCKEYLKSAAESYFKNMQNEGTDVETNGNGTVIDSVDQVDNAEEKLLEDVASTFDVNVNNVKPKKPHKAKVPGVPTHRSLRIQNQDEVLNANFLGSMNITPHTPKNQYSTADSEPIPNLHSTTEVTDSPKVHSTRSTRSSVHSTTSSVHSTNK